MEHFQYREQQLHVEDVPCTDLAERFGTPLYIYSRAAIEARYKAYVQAFGEHPHQIHYAVKANSNLGVLNLLSRLGAGFDIVSGGELTRVLEAGGTPDKIVFSGVGKTSEEMEMALAAGIHCFNVESAAELQLLNMVAGEQDKKAPVSIRVNPDVDARTHPYISTGLRENKFGVDILDAPALYQKARNLPHIRIRGITCHIGSQLTELDPFLDAAQRLLTLVEKLHHRGIEVEYLDLGGGLGVRYQDETPPTPSAYVNALLEILPKGLPIHLEPGRSIVANAGILLTRVLYLKPTADKNFAIVDAAMNDLIRPSLYDAWQEILPVTPHDADCRTWDIVGPVCETGDFLGKDRTLSLDTGDLLAVKGAGAYGFTMASNYNSRNRAAEIIVDDASAYVVRQRETLTEQLRLESIVPD